MSFTTTDPDVGGVPSPRGKIRVAKRGEGTPPTTCRHCGAALIDARMRESGFCCTGCSYVFRLVHEHGLDGYYRVKDEITAPADPAVFQSRDYAWLEAAQRVAEMSSQKIPEITLDLQGISCAGCVWLIERVFQQQRGARDVFVNASFGTMRVRWVRGEFSAAEFARKLQAFGYTTGPAGEATAAEPESRGLGRRIGLCAAFAMNVMLFAFPTYFGMERTFAYASLFGLLAFAFGTLSLLVGGTYFLTRALRALRERTLHIDLPIAIGIVGAYAGSFYGWWAGHERFVYFDFVSAFILLMLIGRWAQVVAVEGNRRRLLRQNPRPEPVQRAGGGRITMEELKVGDEIVLAAGQMLPVDARLKQGDATFSLASINGEADAKFISEGMRVPAGAINLGRTPTELTVMQPWTESLLAQLLAGGERAGWRHAFLEKIMRGYLFGIIAVAVIAGIAWGFATGDALRTGAVVIAVLVVSCPCAVALAFPLADEIATLALRRRGVFVRENDLWSKLAQVTQIVFDKTGTLTLDTPVLKNPEALRGLDAEAKSKLLAIVRDNPHPISASLSATLLADGVASSSNNDVCETPGFGAELGEWSLGRAGWRADSGSATEGATVFARSGVVLAEFQFTHSLRPDARVELAALRRAGFGLHILSGDSRRNVDRIAAELELAGEQVLADLTPQQKAAWFDRHASNNALMLGDGANDSLAFDRALCRGTPAVHRGILERKADFYYLGAGVGGVRALFEVNAIRRRTQTAILVFSVAYNLFAVGLAVAGLMNPLVAAALMPINSLITLAIVLVGMRKAGRGR